MCGLATYGYKIMRVIGVKTVKLSNSRGFCAELSTAIVVMVASRYGLPVSTTQVKSSFLNLSLKSSSHRHAELMIISSLIRYDFNVTSADSIQMILGQSA